MLKKPFTSVEAPIVLLSIMTLQNKIGSPVSASFTKPLMLDSWAMEKSENEMDIKSVKKNFMNAKLMFLM
jgi:hypothetical protein